jgi:hypothetical protein
MTVPVASFYILLKKMTPKSRRIIINSFKLSSSENKFKNLTKMTKNITLVDDITKNYLQQKTI